MKKTIFTTLLLSAGWLISHAQTHEDVLSETVRFEQPSATNVLYVSNINGDVIVEGYTGDAIRIEVNRKITAKTQERLEKGIAEVGIGVLDRFDTLIVYMKNGCRTDGMGMRFNSDNRRWGYDFKNCDPPYDFLFDIKIRVPAGTNLYLSTINQGEVRVKGVNGTLELNNINGDITASDIRQTTVVSAINGDVTLQYGQIPESGRFYSLNGDIEANFPANFNALVTFESFNGDFFTNISDYTQEPVIVKTESREPGTHFKAEARSAITFRNGGPRLDFETFNGNVYIRENNN